MVDEPFGRPTVKTFTDSRPLYGQDPFIFNHDDRYFLIESHEEKRITFSLLNGLQSPQRLETTVIWNSPTEHQVWAPELHLLDNTYYVYYTASNGQNSSHRPYVLSSSKFFGPYEHLGRVGPDIWGIDMTVFNHDGSLYAVWSGWENNGDEFPQHLYIGKMDSPSKLDTRHRISSPQYAWETSVAPILEGPQIWKDNGEIKILYSANASWTRSYSTGILSLKGGEDPLEERSWVKAKEPTETNVGHGMVIDDHFVYHRKMSLSYGWNDREIKTRKM